MNKEELKSLVLRLSDEDAEKILKLYEEKIAGEREAITEEIKEEAYLEATKEIEEKFAQIELQKMIGAELEKANAKNLEVLRALIDMESITLDEGKLSGLTQQLEKLKEECGFIFLDDEEKPKFTKEAVGSSAEMDLGKLSYKERLKLYNEMPELYGKLVK